MLKKVQNLEQNLDEAQIDNYKLSLQVECPTSENDGEDTCIEYVH